MIHESTCSAKVTRAGRGWSYDQRVIQALMRRAWRALHGRLLCNVPRMLAG
jgi:hypothetical protein